MSAMRNQQLTGIVELAVPADPSMLLVVRLTAAGVLARLDVTVDRIDDVKMAVEEATNCLMEQLSAVARVALTFSPGRGQLTIRVSCQDRCPEDRDPMDQQELDVIKCLLEALVDEVSLDVSGGWIRGITLRAALTA